MQAWQALIIAVFVALVQGRLFSGPLTLHMRICPFLTSLFIGIILGDVKTAVITGGVIQLLSMGQVAPAGNMPTEPNVAAAIAVPITILSGMDPKASVAVAIPIGILGGYLYQLQQILRSFLLKYIDKIAKNLEEKKFTASIFLLPQVVALLIHVPIIFVALYFGSGVVADVVQQLEGGLLFHVLSTIGGALGAVGMAMLIRLIDKDKYMVFFFLAFILCYALEPLKISTVTWALIGVMITIIYNLVIMNAKESRAE